MTRRRNVPEAVQASVEVQPSLGRLLDRWRAGDQQAAEAIFRRYEKRLRQFVHAKLGNYLQARLDSDDIVASVFESVF